MSTHRDLCRQAARWLVSRHGRGLYAAAYEIAFDGGVADALAVSVPDPAADVAFRAREYQALRAVAEAKRERRLAKVRGAPTAPLFASQVGAEVKVEPRHHRQVERHAAPVVAVVECKASRSDLLADLAERKITRYERAASECWLWAGSALVVTSSRLTCSRGAVEAWTQPGIDAVLASLAEDGLPPGWGVAVAGVKFPTILRRPTKREVEPWEVVGWAGRIAASWSHRALGDGPVAAEVE